MDFSGRPDVEHAYHGMSEAHRLLRRGGEYHAEAVTYPALKTMEQGTSGRRDWQLAWVISGLPELESAGRVHRGAARSVEAAAGMAFLTEIRAVEERRAAAPRGKGSKKGGGQEGSPGGD